MATSSQEHPAARGSPPGAAELSDIRQDAAGWVVQLQAPHPGDAELLAFDDWLSASAAHRQAYDQALAAWMSAGTAPRRKTGSAIPPARGGRSRIRAPAARNALAWSAAAAAAVLVAVVVARPIVHPTPPADQYATARGEHRVVSLADGTRVELNAATRIEVRLTAKGRYVALREGEAAFDVRHDPARPFVVTTQRGQLEDLGTAFDVRQRGAAFSVTVSRGQVRFAPAAPAAPGAVRLGPGDRLEAIGGAAGYRRLRVNPDEDFDWRRGVLVFRGEPLGSVVAELNLQFAHPVRVEDPRLAARPISGVLRLEDERSTVRRLALFSPMTVLQRDGVTVLEPAADGTR